jgi:exopolyphosphatase/guanosine-5'-triphosphate,3'-diphosphate pyrophosphatase
MTKRQLEKLPEAAAKRADSLPYAAIVFERVLRAGNFEKVALSSYGLREGLLVDKLSPALLRVDPLVASAEAFGAHTLRARAFGAALGQWLTPLREAAPAAFGLARDATLWAAAARLADVGALLHPDQRESLMFELILESPIVGVRHAERAFLAGAVARRYGRVATGRAAFDRLLNDDQKRAALVLGSGMRLAADLSGRAAGLLAAFKLSVQPGVLMLSAQPRYRHLLTDQAQKRLEPAAAALGLVARVSG